MYSVGVKYNVEISISNRVQDGLKRRNIPWRGVLGLFGGLGGNDKGASYQGVSQNCDTLSGRFAVRTY